MQITPDSIVVAAEDQVSCEVDDEAALLNLKTGVYYGLDPMGAYIWRLIAAPVRVGALHEQIAREFSADPDVVAKDITDFLTEMHNAGLVDVSSAAGV
jgi:hypothetical protein